MRKAYQFLNTTPKLYCRLLNRIVQGNRVIDHEEVWGFGEKPFYGVAIYEIKNGKISKVYFPNQDQIVLKEKPRHEDTVFLSLL